MRLVNLYVQRHGHKFRIASHMFSDIEQDIFVKLIRPAKNDGTTYLQRYDPARNSFDGYISGLVFNYFCRLHRARRRPSEDAVSLDMLVEMNLDPPCEAQDGGEGTDATIERIAAQLELDFPYSSGVLFRKPFAVPVTPIGVVRVDDDFVETAEIGVLWRSPANIFRLLALDMDQESISRALQVSKGWISKQTNRIRTHPAVRDWALEMGLRSLDDA